MAFNNLDELYKYIKQEVALSMKTDVAETVREVERRNIQKDVYSYQPKQYFDRRTGNGSGGLDDFENMVAGKPEIVGNHVILTISNETTGYNEPNFYIADLVEYGDPTSSKSKDVGQGYYTYQYYGDEYWYMNPRPFNEDSILELESTGVHIEALQASLNEKFKVK